MLPNIVNFRKTRGQSKFLTLTPCLLLALAISSTTALAESHSPDWAAVTATASSDIVAPGSDIELNLELHMAEGSHANSNTPTDRNLIATTFFPKTSSDLTWGKIKYPKATYVIEWYSVDPLPVFENGAVIKVPLTVSESAEAGTVDVEGKLRIQICDDEQCYPPKRIPVSLSLTVN